MQASFGGFGVWGGSGRPEYLIKRGVRAMSGLLEPLLVLRFTDLRLDELSCNFLQLLPHELTLLVDTTWLRTSARGADQTDVQASRCTLQPEIIAILIPKTLFHVADMRFSKKIIPKQFSKVIL